MQMEDEKRDPRAKFVELANARVARAVKDLRLIGNLSNRRNYDYTEEEAKLILRTLETEIKESNRLCIDLMISTLPRHNKITY